MLGWQPAGPLTDCKMNAASRLRLMAGPEFEFTFRLSNCGIVSYGRVMCAFHMAKSLALAFDDF